MSKVITLKLSDNTLAQEFIIKQKDTHVFDINIWALKNLGYLMSSTKMETIDVYRNVDELLNMDVTSKTSRLQIPILHMLPYRECCRIKIPNCFREYKVELALKMDDDVPPVFGYKGIAYLIGIVLTPVSDTLYLPRYGYEEGDAVSVLLTVPFHNSLSKDATDLPYRWVGNTAIVITRQLWESEHPLMGTGLVKWDIPKVNGLVHDFGAVFIPDDDVFTPILENYISITNNTQKT